MINNPTQDNTKLAIKYMLISSFLFSFTGGFAKELSTYVSSLEVVFFRNITGVIIILYAIYKSPLNQKGGKPFLLFMRGFIGFSALLMYFYNIANIPLAEAQTFSKISPIFTAIFSYLILSEKLSTKAWIGVFIGFIGVLCITGFDVTNLSKTDWFGILSGVGAGLAYTSIRELRKYYDTRAIVMSFMGVGTVAPLILMLVTPYVNVSEEFDWMFAAFVIPKGVQWGYVTAVGIFATISQLLMTKAYELTKAGIVGTISYSNIVFAVVIGIMLGDPIPDIWTVLGIILVIFSGLLVALPKGLK